MGKYAVIYHGSDADGYCGGAVCAHHIEKQIMAEGYSSLEVKRMYMDGTIWMIPAEYSLSAKEYTGIIEDCAGRSVYMVDMSFPAEYMDKLCRSAREFRWFDHHKAVIEESIGRGFCPEGLRIVGKGGCENAWLGLFPDLPIPPIVTAVSYYDTWRFNPKNGYFEVNYGLYTVEMHPNNAEGRSFWFELFQTEGVDAARKSAETLEMLRDRGTPISMYEARRAESALKKHSFLTKWEGYDCLCLNTGNASADSQVLSHSLPKYDILVTFTYRKDRWKVSLRTKKDGIDLSALAKRYGGGGHVRAASFVCSELPFMS